MKFINMVLGVLFSFRISKFGKADMPDCTMSGDNEFESQSRLILSLITLLSKAFSFKTRIIGVLKM